MLETGEFLFALLSLAALASDEVEEFASTVADFPFWDGIAEGFDRSKFVGHASEHSKGLQGFQGFWVGTKDQVNRPNFSRNFGFDFNVAEVCEDFLHPFFGKPIVNCSRHWQTEKCQGKLGLNPIDRPSLAHVSQWWNGRSLIINAAGIAGLGIDFIKE
jgi:hypothetical protein